MKNIEKLIQNMEEVYEELNLMDVNDVDFKELTKLRDFSKGFVSDIQELIYGFKEQKEK